MKISSTELPAIDVFSIECRRSSWGGQVATARTCSPSAGPDAAAEVDLRSAFRTQSNRPVQRGATTAPRPFRRAATASAVLVISCGIAAVEATGHETFIARHPCEVTALLDAIHRRGPVNTSRDRFITLALRGKPQHYVQCIFTNRDTAMVCEASSGAYRAAEDRDPPLVLSPSAVAALQALGYRQDDPRRNYTRMLRLGRPPETGRAADLMLGALADAYGARPDSVIEINAPKGGPHETGCGTPTA